MLTFLYCLNLKLKFDEEINYFNFNGKCKFPLKLIWYLIVLNLFPLEVVQKCQSCQLCVL